MLALTLTLRISNTQSKSRYVVLVVYGTPHEMQDIKNFPKMRPKWKKTRSQCRSWNHAKPAAWFVYDGNVSLNFMKSVEYVNTPKLVSSDVFRIRTGIRTPHLPAFSSEKRHSRRHCKAAEQLQIVTIFRVTHKKSNIRLHYLYCVNHTHAHL